MSLRIVFTQSTSNTSTQHKHKEQYNKQTMNIPNTPNKEVDTSPPSPPVDNMNFILSSEKSSSPPIKSVEVVNHSSPPITMKTSNESFETSDKLWSVRDSLELAKSTNKEGGRESFDAQSPESANSVNKTLPSIEANNLPQETKTIDMGEFTITVSPKKPQTTKKESSAASVTRTLSCSPTISVLSLNLEDKDTKPYDESAKDKDKDDTSSLILNTSKDVETQTHEVEVSSKDITKAKELLKENTAFILDKTEEISMIQNEIVKKVRKDVYVMCLFVSIHMLFSHTQHMHI